MRPKDTLILSGAVPKATRVGQEFHMTLRARVRRIEAEHVDITGYSANGDSEVLEGETEVEFTVLRYEMRAAE